jgi:prepilin-type N-terminal cleavage/methylation domain-containing protein
MQMIKIIYNKTNQNQSGFTMVELSFVVLIMGLLLAGSIKSIEAWYNFETTQKYEESSRIINEAITSFYSVNGRYPCPADPNLDEADPGFGIEDCTLTPVDGARDTNFDANLDPDPLLIGRLPNMVYDNANGAEDVNLLLNLNQLIPRNTVFSKTLEEPTGSNIIYAVSDNLTDSSTFDADIGVIRIRDEENRDTGGVTDNAHYVFIMRADRITCPVSTLPVPAFEADGVTPFTGLFDPETENCDNDFSFVDAIQSHAADGLYYDDIIVYKVTQNLGLWGLIDASTDIRSLNGGKVSVGPGYDNATDPDVLLDVDGNIRVNRHARSDDVCDRASGKCFNPASLYNFSCPNAGEYGTRTEITGNSLTVTCEELSFDGAASCGTGKFMKGIFTDGTVDCVPK